MPSPNTASLIDAWNTVTFEQYNTLAGSHREAYQAGHRPGGIVRIDKNRLLIPQPLPPNVFGEPQPQNSIHFPHVNGTQGIPLQVLVERGAEGLQMLMKGALDMPVPKARYIHLHILVSSSVLLIVRRSLTSFAVARHERPVRVQEADPGGGQRRAAHPRADWAPGCSRVLRVLQGMFEYLSWIEPASDLSIRASPLAV